MHDGEPILLGFSGGIDSCAAASTLKADGWSVTALTLDMTGDEHLTDEARRRAADMDIPIVVMDVRDEFRAITTYFVDSYTAGRTPAPCTLCNSPVIQSNIKALSSYDVSTSVRYSFLKNKLSVTLSLNDIFNSSGKQRLILFGSGFRTDGVNHWNFRRLGVSLRYNFKSGKEFRNKQIETGETQEAQREQGGAGSGR